MKGLSRKKFYPCRQQFLAASPVRPGNHASFCHEALAPGVQRPSKPLQLTVIPLSTVFVFALVLPFA